MWFLSKFFSRLLVSAELPSTEHLAPNSKDYSLKNSSLDKKPRNKHHDSHQITTVTTTPPLPPQHHHNNYNTITTTTTCTITTNTTNTIAPSIQFSSPLALRM
jgi:hypothetical protein